MYYIVYNRLLKKEIHLYHCPFCGRSVSDVGTCRELGLPVCDGEAAYWKDYYAEKDAEDKRWQIAWEHYMQTYPWDYQS